MNCNERAQDKVEKEEGIEKRNDKEQGKMSVIMKFLNHSNKTIYLKRQIQLLYVSTRNFKVENIKSHTSTYKDDAVGKERIEGRN